MVISTNIKTCQRQSNDFSISLQLITSFLVIIHWPSVINIFLFQSKIIVSRSHAGKVHDVAADVFGSDVTVTGAGGAGFKAWEVAAGRQDAYVHTTLIKKWDICPGTALMTSLGGKLTTLDGSEIDFGGKPAKVKNEGGLIAAIHDHDLYVEKLKHIAATKK